MTSTHASLNTGPSLGAMARIETIRLARNPFFVLVTLVTVFYAVFLPFNAKHDTPSDLLSWPVIPAFFIGLTSLVMMARQTRSTEAATEAMSAAPGTEARRTQALVVACLLPAGLGVAFTLAEVIVAGIMKPAPQEWWFGTLPDARVWAILLAGGPVACLGGALLGVLVGRWLHFPGAPAVVVVGLVVGVMLGQISIAESSHPVLRLWSPWVMWHSGTETDGTATVYGGNPTFYFVYALCLCAAAALLSIRHDRTARTPRLAQTFAAVVVVGLVALGLSMTAGDTDSHTSDPVPWLVK